MYENKLISLFKTLSSKELRELKQFVRSPFHNPKEDVVRLFDELRKANMATLNEEKLHQAIFPGSPFNKKALAYVMNYLMKVIEDYFAIQAFYNNEAQRVSSVAKVALEHQQESIFHLKVKKAKKLLNESGLENIETHQLHYELEMALCDQQKNQVRGEALNLKQPSSRLEIIVISTMLRQACSLLAHENLAAISYEHGLLNHILAYLESPEQKHLLDLPVIALHYFSYKTLKEDAIEHFKKLKELLLINSKCFTQNDLKNFYAIGINFSIKQLNKGNRAYVREAFDLYQKALQEEVLLEHATLSQFHYKNIAALGLGLKEYDWVEHFLIDYHHYLEPKNRTHNFNYNFAKLHYEKGEYKAAMHLLQAVKYDDSLPNLTSKILLMKIYYELDEKKVLDSYLNSFEGMVRRQKKLGYHKKNYLNLISIMKKLLNLNLYDKAAVQKFKAFIATKDRLPEKKWLLMQL